MGEVLAELEHFLRANDKEKITLDEELVLQKCKSRAVNTFLMSAGLSSALVWGGAALVLGGWTFDRSLNSSVKRILVAHGTRMQKELTNIVMTRNLENLASSVSKVFYAEHVYDDTTYDKPSIRWRARNTYEDNVMIADSLKDSVPRNLPSAVGSQPKIDIRKTSGATTVGLGELIADPLDCILGFPEAGGDTSQNVDVVSKRDVRAHRRWRRPHHSQRDKDFSHHTNSDALTM